MATVRKLAFQQQEPYQRGSLKNSLRRFAPLGVVLASGIATAAISHDLRVDELNRRTAVLERAERELQDAERYKFRYTTAVSPLDWQVDLGKLDAMLAGTTPEQLREIDRQLNQAAEEWDEKRASRVREKRIALAKAVEDVEEAEEKLHSRRHMWDGSIATVMAGMWVAFVQLVHLDSRKKTSAGKRWKTLERAPEPAKPEYFEELCRKLGGRLEGKFEAGHLRVVCETLTCTLPKEYVEAIIAQPLALKNIIQKHQREIAEELEKRELAFETVFAEALRNPFSRA